MSTNDLFGPPNHGATMFRRDAYERVGGYRPEFYFAQDLDPWPRLGKRGPGACLGPVVREATLDTSSINGKYRREQEQPKALTIRCGNARLMGQPEMTMLQAAGQVRPENRSYDASKGEYFIARLLESLKQDKALIQYKTALSKTFFNWKAQIRYTHLRMRARAE